MKQNKGKMNWSNYSKDVDNVLGEDFWNDLHHVIPKRGPSFDMYETDTEGVIVFELPGLRSIQDIHIKQNGTQLVLQGNIAYPYPVKPEELSHNERFTGEFKRIVSVPFHYNPEHVKARYKNGLLEIHIQKAASEDEIIIDLEDDR
ncbi:Hsp20/alpha crystallin family protein [Alkalihalobacillus sp. AL-G]|uniref:Hsp20/alpha crystallin family protein n=1 Tax=Alkalihalobacillus sp. AL-G TaxID=2926399 RepID=UPI00272B0613|nr:Hsp20/alpha crystallin family protein [Alkalihalobacillus sp. AL-G]WLD93293.1 Hsp20/alpha crystallin family protein [Alkalihalobacillus sp. AL-G]